MPTPTLVEELVVVQAASLQPAVQTTAVQTTTAETTIITGWQPVLRAMDKALVKASKFLSLLLRHQPDTVGLILDDQGWVDVDELLEKVNAAGRRWDLELLQQVVATNDKRRFRFSDDGKRIRANQGHSVDVDLQLEPAEPPELLFHGTAQRNLQSILRAGLDKRRRKHVHLSSDRMTAHKVGSRHGSPIVLAIASARMYADGLIFFLSDNQVWLTDSVPPEYISY